MLSSSDLLLGGDERWRIVTYPLITRFMGLHNNARECFEVLRLLLLVGDIC